MVNVNKVYETVLSILNKEQRGYLDPTEFNHLAVQVQREIFESYFLKEAAAPGNNTDYSDPEMNIAEKMAIFEREAAVGEVRTGDRADTSFFLYPSDFYRLGVVLTQGTNIVIDEVSHKEAAYINLSHLTAPSAKQPIYVKENGGIKVYPDNDTIGINNIIMNYLKIPTDPVWGFNQSIFMNGDTTNDIAVGTVLYDSAASTDFELHPSEEHEIIIRILAYAGVVVRAPEITGFAQQVEQKIQGTEA